MNGDIQVWIVEDNAFFRDTVAELIDQQAGMCCALAAGTCEEAIEHIAAGDVPQVLFMDLELPGMSGIEGIRQIQALSPASHIVVLSIHEEDDTVFEALCAGACGYLLKPASGQRIVEAVETARRGGAPMNAFIARKVLGMFAGLVRPRGDYGLTEREREILLLLVQARPQKQIAVALSLSPHTVDTHIRNIYAKLQVHSRSAAVAKAVQERLA